MYSIYCCLCASSTGFCLFPQGIHTFYYTNKTHILLNFMQLVYVVVMIENRPLLTNLYFTNLIFFDRILYYNCSVDVFTTSEFSLVSNVIAISSEEKNKIYLKIYLLVQAVQILQYMFSFSFHTPMPGYWSTLCILFDRVETVLSLDHHPRGKWFRFGGLMAWFMEQSLWQLMPSTCTWWDI